MKRREDKRGKREGGMKGRERRKGEGRMQSKERDVRKKGEGRET